MSEETCEQRIYEHLQGRLEAFDELLENDEDDERYEYPLWVDSYRVVRVDLSTGGPADWFEIKIDGDNDVDNITYHFSDWFDHAEYSLHGSEFDRALEFLEPFCELY